MYMGNRTVKESITD